MATEETVAYVDIATEVAAQGWTVRRDFVSRAAVTALRARLEAWWEAGELREAGIGRGANLEVRKDIRRDHVRWLDFTHGLFAELLATHLEPLRLAMNRTMYLGLHEYEGHVTVYPPGAFYRRHVDQFRDAAHRKLSVILYLNDADWSEDDGGQLRLFIPDGDGERAVDVLPECGTLVVFLSHEIPHEVLPTKRERFSLTGWFRTRD